MRLLPQTLMAVESMKLMPVISPRQVVVGVQHPHRLEAVSGFAYPELR